MMIWNVVRECIWFAVCRSRTKKIFVICGVVGNVWLSFVGSLRSFLSFSGVTKGLQGLQGAW